MDGDEMGKLKWKRFRDDGMKVDEMVDWIGIPLLL